MGFALVAPSASCNCCACIPTKDGCCTGAPDTAPCQPTALPNERTDFNTLSESCVRAHVFFLFFLCVAVCFLIEQQGAVPLPGRDGDEPGARHLRLQAGQEIRCCCEKRRRCHYLQERFQERLSTFCRRCEKKKGGEREKRRGLAAGREIKEDGKNWCGR